MYYARWSAQQTNARARAARRRTACPAERGEIAAPRRPARTRREGSPRKRRPLGVNTATGGCSVHASSGVTRPHPAAAPCKIFMYSPAAFFNAVHRPFFTPPLVARPRRPLNVLLNVRRASAQSTTADSSRSRISLSRGRSLVRLLGAARRDGRSRASCPSWKIRGIRGTHASPRHEQLNRSAANNRSGEKSYATGSREPPFSLEP